MTSVSRENDPNMRRASSELRNVAERLIAHEHTHGQGPVGSAAIGAFRACERLRPQLAILMGTMGFRALLSRALALATVEVPWLHATHVDTAGTIVFLDGREAPVDSGALDEGGVVLLAQLVGLLVAFIGPSLTSQLLCEAWPTLQLTDRDFETRT